MSLKLRLAKLEARNANKVNALVLLWMDHGVTEASALTQWLIKTKMPLPNRVIYLSWQN
jgi:hypothetical protein